MKFPQSAHLFLKVGSILSMTGISYHTSTYLGMYINVSAGDTKFGLGLRFQYARNTNPLGPYHGHLGGIYLDTI